MNESWIIKYGYLIGAAVMLVVGIALIYFITKRDSRSGKNSFMAYLLVWPALINLEQRKSTKRTRKHFVVVGLIVILALVVGSILLHPETR